jgi:hypothetical protein
MTTLAHPLPRHPRRQSCGFSAFPRPNSGPLADTSARRQDRSTGGKSGCSAGLISHDWSGRRRLSVTDKCGRNSFGMCTERGAGNLPPGFPSPASDLDDREAGAGQRVTQSTAPSHGQSGNKPGEIGTVEQDPGITQRMEGVEHHGRPLVADLGPTVHPGFCPRGPDNQQPRNDVQVRGGKPADIRGELRMPQPRGEPLASRRIAFLGIGCGHGEKYPGLIAVSS